MSFLTAFLTGSATYWRRSGTDGYGQPTFDSPVAIRCRWEDKNEMIMSNDGTTVISRSKVFLERDTVAGDYLFRGVSTTANPRQVEGAFPILQVALIPGLDDNLVERRVYL